MTLLRVFISSPGDVAQERAIARRVLGRVQGAHAGRLRLEPVLWEQQPLLASDTFQSQLINPSATDIVVAILWARLGTPLPSALQRADGSSYRSGTEFEIEDALAAARASGTPKLLIYRKTAPPSRWFVDAADATDAAAQTAALEEFLTRLLRDDRDGSFRGAFHSFVSAADFEDLLEQHLHRLLAGLLQEGSEAPESAVTAWAFGSPFRGLQSFELEHAPLFFGRTAATALAIERLQEQARRGRAFVLLLGMSGGGKSSLAKAGVLPMLMQPGVVESAGAWRHALLTPGQGRGDLVLALAVALTERTALPNLGAAATLAAACRTDPASIVTRVSEALAAAGEQARLALIVDQLEEIFSDDSVSAAERALFIVLLDALARSGVVWIVATLRSDFYPRCIELPTLLALKEGAGQYDLAPPLPAEVGQMIRNPAAAAGLRFEQDARTGERLDERLRDLTADRPSVLPLLEFTLEELYRRRTPDGVLTFAAHDEIGGLEGAIAHRAESVYAEQPGEVQAALPRVFERLVAIGDDDEAVLRRRAPLESFVDPAERALVRALVDARLLVTDLGSAEQSHVTVAHEALLRHWPRVVEWLAANRELLRSRSRVGLAALRWQREERRTEFLLAQGKPYAEAQSLRAAGVPLDPLELEFVLASERRVRRTRRVRTAAVLTLAVLALAATGAAIVAVRQAALAQREATTASRTSEFLASLFAIVDPGESRGNQVTARELLDRGATTIRSELRDEPLVRAGLLTTMGMAYSGLGIYEPALQLTAEALAERRQRLGRDHPDTLESQIAHAIVLYQSARYTEAEPAFREAMVTADSLYPDGSIQHVRATIGLGDTLTLSGETSQAEREYRQALQGVRTLAGGPHREEVYALSGLATSLYFQSRLGEAQASFEECARLGEPVLGAGHPKIAETVNNLGSIAYQQARYADAQRLFERALPLYRANFGADHPEVANVLNNLARVALLERRFDEARQRLDEALAIHLRYKDAAHDDLILPYNSLGLANLGRGDLTAARVAIDQALRIARDHEHWMLGVVLTSLADLELRSADVAAAGRAIEEARPALLAAFPPETRADEGWRFAVLDSIDGARLSRLGDPAAARGKLLDSIDVVALRFGESSLYAVDAMQRAEDYYRRSGDKQGAAALRVRLAKAIGKSP